MLAFTALADPTRLRIVEMLACDGRLSAADIGGQFSISAPAISQHLKVLREANLVHVESKAQQRIYTINPAGMSEIESWLSDMRKLWEKRFDALDKVLEKELMKMDIKKAKKPKQKIKRSNNV